MQHLTRTGMFKLRFFIVSILTAVIIVACQSDSAHQDPNSQPQADCRTVQHALGEVCVPTDPQRLISLDETTLADAIALEVPSIGASLEDGRPPTYLADSRSPLESTGTSEQPNLEKILQLNPDLILGVEFYGEPIFKQLSQIAPTALGNWSGYPSWREHFDFVAKVLGKENKAQQVWKHYKQRTDETRMALDIRLQELEVSVIYACCGTITIDAENSFAGGILADIGIRRPKDHAAVDDGIIILSEELIPKIDADIVFVSVYDAESEQVLADWQQKPLWNQLKAVQKGQVYVVDYDIWRGGNPIAANLLISDLVEYLVEDRP